MALITNLVSYWKLDEASGNAADSVGSNTLTNNGTVTYGAAKINNGAFLASASSQYLLNTAFLTAQTSLSWSAWIKTSTTTGQQTIFEHNAGASAQISIEVFGNKIRVLTWDGATGLNFSSVASVNDNVFHHIVVTKSGTSFIIYVDGASNASATLGNISVGASLCMGRDNINTTAYFNGTLDEVGIWSRALTSTEVTSLYNGGAGLQYPFLPPNTSNFFAFF